MNSNSQPTEQVVVTPDSGRGRIRQIVLALLLPVLATVMLLSTIWSVNAAAVIEYFNAISSSQAVLLEWSTASEYNVAGFEILCKKTTEPDNLYHRIHYVESKGNPTLGARYDYLVTRLEPGVAYCFRLHEVTTDGEPGEMRDVCGYGLSLTPTPTPLGGPVTPTSTLPFSLAFTITPTVDPFATPTIFFQPDSPLQTPTPLGAVPGQPPLTDAAGNPIVNQPSATDINAAQVVSNANGLANTASGPGVPAPLSVVTMTPTLPFDGSGLADLPTDLMQAGLQTNTLSVDLAATPTPFVSPLAAPDPSLLTPTITATLPTSGAVSSVAGETLTAGTDVVGAASAPLDPGPTPTSLYVVVTAEPTLAPLALAPMLTPWPTTTPLADASFASLFVPTAQNLTVMLLCFIFVSASGLGVLGLITSVLYMRSRSRRDGYEMQRRYRGRL